MVPRREVGFHFSDGDVDTYDEGDDGLGDESDDVPHDDGDDALINVPDNASYSVPSDVSQTSPTPTVVTNNVSHPDTMPQLYSGVGGSTTIENTARNMCEVVIIYTPD